MDFQETDVQEGQAGLSSVLVSTSINSEMKQKASRGSCSTTSKIDKQCRGPN